MARNGPRLTRDAVLTAALAVIDESGLDACTMRSVASGLGVEAMSLYWHVPGKDALLDGVVEKILEEVQESHESRDDWREWMSTFGLTFREVLLRHPNALLLLADRPLGAYAAASRLAGASIEIFERAGFDRRTAMDATRTFSRFVVGSAIFDVGTRNPTSLSTPDAESVVQMMESVVSGDPVDLYAFGLLLMIAGLEAELARAGG